MLLISSCPLRLLGAVHSKKLDVECLQGEMHGRYFNHGANL